MQFGGKGVTNPLQMIMAGIDAAMGGFKGFSIVSSGDTKVEAKGGKDSGKGCYNCGKAGNIARGCPYPKEESRACHMHG